MSLLRRRLMMAGMEDEMKEFKVIATGDLAGNAATDIECNGLTEFYIIVAGAQTDGSTKEYFDIAINDVHCKEYAAVNNHAWLYYWYWHCKKVGDYWFTEHSVVSNGATILGGTAVYKNSNPLPKEGAEANKISIQFTGTANVTSGSYEVIGR